MKLLLIIIASISAGVASSDHINSFLLGLSVSALAVGSCYWFAFRSSRFPLLATLLLLCGLLSKLAITVIGVMVGIQAEIITSPLVFALAYLFFSLVISYLWFAYRDAKTEKPKKLVEANV
ncbi:NADH:ubiquinone oxidoreductase [Vibrio tapetis]|uniref:NADH:ubiquinone oxidoreductase subunit 2 n=1 Tax=Vibrio tapetis subsp. tapetis TaxID=1671868 RepID=A0A2N8ZIG5_9VIBR|nr:NADH:ubiquinone oxidoreductase [Vibrio tapetis]SON51681.1 NADH:ubiquinone oxidoreductase subunit 2 [Vibrio tapetis subsp. tapetis]